MNKSRFEILRKMTSVYKCFEEAWEENKDLNILDLKERMKDIIISFFFYSFNDEQEEKCNF